MKFARQQSSGRRKYTVYHTGTRNQHLCGQWGETIHMVHMGDCGQRQEETNIPDAHQISASPPALSTHFPNEWALHLPQKRMARDIQSFPIALQILVKTVRSLVELIYQHNPNQTTLLKVMPEPQRRTLAPAHLGSVASWAPVFTCRLCRCQDP